jgi:hypothetical protein
LSDARLIGSPTFRFCLRSSRASTANLYAAIYSALGLTRRVRLAIEQISLYLLQTFK